MTLADDIFGASSDARVQLTMLMAASGLESSMLWNPAPAVNPNDPNGGSFGPFQINGIHFGQVAPNGVVIDAQTAQDPATAVSFMLSSYQWAVQQFSDAQWQQDPAGTAALATQLAEGSTGYAQTTVSDAFQKVTGLAPSTGAGIIGPGAAGVTFVGGPFGTLKHWLWTGPGPFEGPLKGLLKTFPVPGLPGGLGSVPGGSSIPTPNIPNPLSGLGAIGAFFSTLNKPQLWKSIGLTALAVVVLLVGVVIVVASNKTVQQDVRGAGSTAAMAGA